MAHVFCLVGPMACGKSEVYNLCKDHFSPTKSITTRPIRETEDGNEYYFVDNDTFLKMLNNNEIIEYRKKELNNEIIYYGTSFKSIDVNSDNNYLKPLDETGVIDLKKYLGEDNVTAIYLECNKRIRMKRAKNREPNIDMNLLLKRFNDDKNTVETFKNHCDLVFKNESKEDLRYIVNFIKSISSNQDL